MPKIIQLDRHVADLIAAGEVVERPASAVKELVENSIDAGAKNITIELQNGGMTFLRITDDGCGMEPVDARTAFLRHATSKIRKKEDLACIGTLGFRGEALAAISSVSKIDLLTRAQGAENGVRLHLEAGQVLSEEPAGCPYGTTILVRELFYNTPARMKFMKSDAAESSAVFSVVQQQALAHPEISFRFLKDGQEQLHTDGQGDRMAAIYAIYGRELANNMLPVDGSWEKLRVRGFVTKPTATRGNRAWQSFFVNNRYIKSRLLSAALEEAYRNQIMVGRFPACVLEIDMPVQAVDVNVHPAKKTSMIIETADPAPFQSAEVYLAKFAFATDVTFTAKYEGSTDGMVNVATPDAKGFIPMMELIDRDKELARLNKELTKAEKELGMFTNQLNNPKFVEKAPAKLVEETRAKLAAAQDKAAKIKESIAALG